MTTQTRNEKYYVPEPSPWPFMTVIAMVVTFAGFAIWLNGDPQVGRIMFPIGLVLLCIMAFVWFRGVIRENRRGAYAAQEDMTFRLAMSWFIFSEVMFFGAFFGALFHARILHVPWLGGENGEFLTNDLLWPNYAATWPTNGPGNIGGAFETMPPFGIPLINTLLLLSSGVTITIAHWGLKAGKRLQLNLGLIATILLGWGFLYCQATEYAEAYTHLNLTLHSGIYGSTFFMLTGFHGLHVTLGTIMLCVILGRCLKGHFSEHDHFGFEGVAWYWHFVDVVWLCLFIFVYVL